MNLRNILAGIVVLVALVFATRKVLYLTSSPEDQIRSRFAAMEVGFNATITAAVLGGFAEEYADESGTDRRGIRDALVYLFFQEYGGEGQGFSLRLEIPREELLIEVDPEEPGRAEVSLHAIFHRKSSGDERLYWDARGHAELVDRGDEWEIVRTWDFNHRDRGR